MFILSECVYGLNLYIELFERNIKLFKTVLSFAHLPVFLFIISHISIDKNQNEVYFYIFQCFPILEEKRPIGRGW